MAEDTGGEEENIASMEFLRDKDLFSMGGLSTETSSRLSRLPALASLIGDLPGAPRNKPQTMSLMGSFEFK
jgi:hypothetical protein